MECGELQRKQPLPRSGRPAARVAKRQDTRRKLMTAGRKLFRQNGVEPVSVQDIANLAEVSRATVYLHFAGKPLLLEALLREDWSGQERLFQRLRELDFADSEMLRQWIMRVAQGMLQARDSFAIHRAALGQNPELTIGHQKHRRGLAAILLGAIDAGLRDGGDAARREIEAELIVAELEYFATAATLGWSEKQVAQGALLVANRVQEFAGVAA